MARDRTRRPSTPVTPYLLAVAWRLTALDISELQICGVGMRIDSRRPQTPASGRVSSLSMDIEGALLKLLEEIGAPLAAADAEVRAAEAKRARLQVELQGLRLALERVRESEGRSASAQGSSRSSGSASATVNVQGRAQGAALSGGSASPVVIRTAFDVVPPVTDEARGRAFPVDRAAEWLELNRAGAVERVLWEHRESMHRRDVVRTLADHGRNDNISAVSAALAYLNRTGRAVGQGHGMWVHPACAQASDVQTAGGETDPGNDDGPGTSGTVVIEEGGEGDDSGGDHRRDPAIAG